MSAAREDSRLIRQVYAGALQRDPEERARPFRGAGLPSGRAAVLLV